MTRSRKYFASLNIQRKMTVIHALIVIFALFPVFVILSVYQYITLRDAVINEVKTVAQIVSDNVIVAMAFEDDKSAGESLATLRASNQISYACLILPSGTVLTSYHIDESTIPDCTTSASQDYSEKLSFSAFKLYQPLYFNANFVGHLELEATLAQFYMNVKINFIVLAVSILIGTIMAFILATKLKDTILKPLSLLMHRVNLIRHEQDYSIDTTIDSQDEIGDLSRAFQKLVMAVKERDEKLRKLAFYDNVTGLPNRHYFSERIEHGVNKALRYSKRCCLMFIDLDDFKIVNDTLGHHIGDELLKEVGRRLSTLLRKTDLVFRIGGDEFAIILENSSNLDDVTLLAAKIINTLSEQMEIESHPVKIGASIGISLCPDLADDTSSLMQTADSAMYVAKARSKNTYHVYEKSLDEKENKKE